MTALSSSRHERTQDRVRRFSYETIQNVVIWQKVPWLRIIICAVFLLLPGIGLMFMSNTASTVTGWFLIIVGGGLVGWFSYCRVTTIRIVRAGRNNDLTGMFRPGRVRRFRDRLIAGIRATQSSALKDELVEPT